MSDIISRQKAIDAAIEAADDWDGGCSKERDRFIRYALEELPSAEPKKGKWIKTENVGRFLGTLWVCSECGCAHADNIFCISGDFNFCPNCGADMRQEE